MRTGVLKGSNASLSGNNEDGDELNILGEVDGHLRFLSHL